MSLLKSIRLRKCKIIPVPEEIRRIKIDKVLAMDYRTIGKRIFKEFKEYVEEENAF